ncbi:hypothetical protein DFQ28_001775 [Apophysomyces sp. BC1034]|nr:hypothetical protein DFQ28_001775 [Apophysomyces sp. BC1034]
MQAATFSFRTGNEFAQETRSLADTLGVKSSDCIREAVREKNERVMAERIAMLSRKLSAKHLAFNESLDDTVGDGLG